MHTIRRFGYIDGIQYTSQAEVAMAMKGRGSAEWQERLLTVLSGLSMKIYLFCFSSTYFVVRFLHDGEELLSRRVHQ